MINQLPESWQIANLGDVLTLVRNGTTQKQNQEGKGVPVTRIETISNGVINLERVGWLEDNQDLSDYRLRVGDILFSHINSIDHLGKCAIYEGNPPNLLHGMNLLLLRCKKSLIEPKFLLQYLRTPSALRLIRARAGKAVNQASINQRELQSLQIPLPPLLEQRRIIAIIDQAEYLLRLRYQADEKSQELLSALFTDMFGHPSNWGETEPLKNLVDFVGGGTPSRNTKVFFTGNIPWATSKDIKSRYLTDAQEHITEEAIKNSATNLVPAGTILMVVKSKILLHSLPTGITTRPFCFGQDLKGLVCKSDIEPQFIVAALHAQTDSILRKARGVNTEGLTLEILREIPIPKTALSQRKKFVNRIKEYDQIERERLSTANNLETLFKSLQFQAFNGTLTAAWHISYAEELYDEMAQQNIVLNEGRNEHPQTSNFREDTVTQFQREAFENKLADHLPSVLRFLVENLENGETLTYILNHSIFVSFAQLLRPAWDNNQNIVLDGLSAGIASLSRELLDKLVHYLKRLSEFAGVQQPMETSVELFYFTLMGLILEIADKLQRDLYKSRQFQYQRAIRFNLDKNCSTLLSKAEQQPAYFLPKDLIDEQIGIMEVEEGLHILAAMGFVRKVLVRDRILYRLINPEIDRALPEGLVI